MLAQLPARPACVLYPGWARWPRNFDSVIVHRANSRASVASPLGGEAHTSELLQTKATPLHSACTSYKTPCLCPDGPGALIALTAPLLADELDLKH